jgi:hypothetical protein
VAGQPRDLAHGVALFLKKTNVHELIQIEHGCLWLSGVPQAITQTLRYELTRGGRSHGGPPSSGLGHRFSSAFTPTGGGSVLNER